MDKKAIEKAESRFRVASKAASELGAAKSFQDFTDSWYSFLHASKGIYTVLEQGAKASAQSRQWFGAKARERKADELLQYVYEARNDDEHGLEPITALKRGGLAIGVAKPGFSSSMVFNGTLGPGGSLNVEALDGKPVLIEHIPDSFVLGDIAPRGRPKMAPPKTHLGEPLPSQAPSAVAETTLRYMRGLVDEASRLS